MADLESDLDALGQAVERAVEPAPDPSARPVPSDDSRTGRAPLLALAAALVLLPLATAVWISTRSGGDGDERSEPALAEVQPASDTYGFQPGWHLLEPGPLAPREDAAVVWTGAELVVWAGIVVDDDGPVPRSDGAVYDPAARSWRPLPPAPVDGGSATGVWTGEEVVFLVADAAETAQGDLRGAALNVAARTWRPLAAPPAGASAIRGVADEIAWTGSEVVVPGSDAAYSPATDSWRAIAPSPIEGEILDVVWTGDSLLTVERGSVQSFSYAPDDDAWRSLGRLPLDPAEVRFDERDGSVVAVDSELNSAYLSSRSTAFEAAGALPSRDYSGGTDIVAVGDRFLARHFSGAGLTEDGKRWQVVPDAPEPISRLVSGGSVAFGWWSTDDAVNFPDGAATFLQVFVPPKTDDLAPFDAIDLSNFRLDLDSDWTLTSTSVVQSNPAFVRRLRFEVQLDEGRCLVQTGYYGDGSVVVSEAQDAPNATDIGSVAIDGVDYAWALIEPDDQSPPGSTAVVAQWPEDESSGSDVLRIECADRALVDRVLDNMVRVF